MGIMQRKLAPCQTLEKQRQRRHALMQISALRFLRCTCRHLRKVVIILYFSHYRYITQVLDGKEDSLALAGSRAQVASDQPGLRSFLVPSRPPPQPSAAPDAPGASELGRGAAAGACYGAFVDIRPQQGTVIWFNAVLIWGMVLPRS